MAERPDDPVRMRVLVLDDSAIFVHGLELMWEGCWPSRLGEPPEILHARSIEDLTERASAHPDADLALVNP